MAPDVLRFINILYLGAFGILVILAIIRILARYVDYRRQGLEVPVLLYRDLFLFLGLGAPGLITLFLRSVGIQNVTEQWWYPWWVIISGLGFVGGAAYWVYYEYFKIDRE